MVKSTRRPSNRRHLNHSDSCREHERLGFSVSSDPSTRIRGTAGQYLVDRHRSSGQSSLSSSCHFVVAPKAYCHRTPRVSFHLPERIIALQAGEYRLSRLFHGWRI